MKNLDEMKFCLCVNILQQEDVLYIDHRYYIVEILDQFDMKDYQSSSIPIKSGQK